MIRILIIILTIFTMLSFKTKADVLISGELSRNTNTEISSFICIKKDVNNIFISNLNPIFDGDNNIDYTLKIKADSEIILNNGNNNIPNSIIECNETSMQYEIILSVNNSDVINTKSNNIFNSIVSLEMFKDTISEGIENIIISLTASEINIFLSDIAAIYLDNNINQGSSNLCIYGNGESDYQIKITDDTNLPNFYLVNDINKIEIKIKYNNGKGVEEELFNNIYSQSHKLDISDNCSIYGQIKVEYIDDIKNKMAGYYKAASPTGNFYVIVSTIIF